MDGDAKGVIRVTSRLQVPFTAHISSVGGKKILVMNLLTQTHYATVATSTSPHNQANIIRGKLEEKAKMLLISLGWRVTPTEKKIVS